MPGCSFRGRHRPVKRRRRQHRGGIAAVVPNVMGLCVWSPGLDEKGNSLLGRHALHRFTRMTGLSVFQATG